MFVTPVVIHSFFSPTVFHMYFLKPYSLFFCFHFYLNLLSETRGLEGVGVGRIYFATAEIKFQNCVLMKSFCYGQICLFHIVTLLPLLPGSRKGYFLNPHCESVVGS